MLDPQIAKDENGERNGLFSEFERQIYTKDYNLYSTFLSLGIL